MVLLYLEVTPLGDKLSFLSMGTVFQYQLLEGKRPHPVLGAQLGLS